MDELSKKRLEEILAKDPSEISEEERGFLRARRSYLAPGYEEKFALTPKPAVKSNKRGRPKKK